MIRVIQKGYWIAVPEFCCDVCMKPITAAHPGLFCWFGDLEPDQYTVLFVAHKGSCDSVLQTEQQGRGRFHEIERGLELLLENAKEPDTRRFLGETTAGIAPA
jgi:hypothetical protein